MNKIKAFTLAEVLITLGIIGVVAAMTLPTLINKKNNSIIETRLKKFYSSMNQAINLSETVNGEKSTWTDIIPMSDQCKDNLETQKCTTSFFETYLKPYLKYTTYKYLEGKGLIVNFTDGSSVRIKQPFDYYFYPKGFQKEHIENDSDKGRIVFPFKIGSHSWVPECVRKEYKKNSFEPFLDGNWNCTPEGLYTSPYFSTKLIQYNGWKIPDDYPW